MMRALSVALIHDGQLYRLAGCLGLNSKKGIRSLIIIRGTGELVQNATVLLQALIKDNANLENLKPASTSLGEELAKSSKTRDTQNNELVRYLAKSLQLTMEWIAQRARRLSQIEIKRETERNDEEFCNVSDSGLEETVKGKEEEAPQLMSMVKSEKPSDHGAWSDDCESNSSDSAENENDSDEDKENGSQRKKRSLSSQDKSTKCDICGKVFTTAGTLRVHKLTHLNDPTAKRPYGCDQCEKRFTQAGSLSVHKRKHLDENDPRLAKFRKIWKCKICQKEFNYPSSLRNHETTHLGQSENKRPHKCAVCDKGFADKGAMKRHELLHTGKLPFSCRLCPRSYNERRALRKHMEGHAKGTIRVISIVSATKNHKCTLCPKRFSRDFELAAHIKRHADDTAGLSSDYEMEVVEETFDCHHCHKTYSNQDKLDRHYYRIHYDYPISCSLCDRKYKRKHTLAYHMKTDHGVEVERDPTARVRHSSIPGAFKCENCPRTFRTEFAREEHKTIHAGPSSFKCSKCSNEFPTFALLCAHKKVHDPLPFNCRKCGKKYAEMDELIEHKKLSESMKAAGYQNGCATKHNDIPSKAISRTVVEID